MGTAVTPEEQREFRADLRMMEERMIRRTAEIVSDAIEKALLKIENAEIRLTPPRQSTTDKLSTITIAALIVGFGLKILTGEQLTSILGWLTK
jgi:hypothetical protein